MKPTLAIFLLLVSVCLSASHIAFGSIRMEPVFMILGQSAAAMAIDANSPVQQIDYPKLKQRLLADHQILTWDAPPLAPEPSAALREEQQGICQ